MLVLTWRKLRKAMVAMRASNYLMIVLADTSWQSLSLIELLVKSLWTQISFASLAPIHLSR